MDNRFLDVENKYIEMVNFALDSIRGEFDSIFITIDGPNINRSDSNNYTSEITLSFYQDRDLIDQLEFFIYKDGIEENALEEARLWLVENFKIILEENRN